MTDYNKIAMDNLNALMREIAEYSRMAEEIGETLDSNDRNSAFPVRVRRCKKWVFYSCWFSRSCCWLRF